MKLTITPTPASINHDAQKKTKSHPCFNSEAHEYARLHLPVAPGCNIQCNYCSRKYDCVNESRPGVTSSLLSPIEAVEKFLSVRESMNNLRVVGIAGPGDALHDFEKTYQTLKEIREVDKDITFCLSTNGLMLPDYVDELIGLGVSHLTVTINTVDPNVGAKIYGNIQYYNKRYTGLEGAKILIKNQFAGLYEMASKGAVCKVNIVMVKGINDNCVADVVREAKKNGAVMTNIMKMIPVKGSAFENLSPVSNQELQETRNNCSVDLKQMYHCRQCRADAVGTLKSSSTCSNF